MMSSGDDGVGPSWPANEHWSQPTVEQEEFASGFDKALDNIHKSRGAPLNHLSMLTLSQAPYGTTSTSPDVVVGPPTNRMQPSAPVPIAIQQGPFSNLAQYETASVHSSNQCAATDRVCIKYPPSSAAASQHPSAAGNFGVFKPTTTAFNSNVLDGRKRRRMNTFQDTIPNVGSGSRIDEPVAGSSGQSVATCAPLPLFIESVNDEQSSGMQLQQYGDDDKDKSAAALDPKKARNRCAATKCRLKKIAQTNKMKLDLAETTAENEKMAAEKAKLQSYLSAMEAVLMRHQNNGLCKLRHSQPKED